LSALKKHGKCRVLFRRQPRIDRRKSGRNGLLLRLSRPFARARDAMFSTFAKRMTGKQTDEIVRPGEV
jgi:hypothetical protein